MRTTVELPGDLLARAKSHAALAGMSLKEFFIHAVERQLASEQKPEQKKVRRPPPVIGRANGPRIRPLTRKQIDEAMFG